MFDKGNNLTISFKMHFCLSIWKALCPTMTSLLDITAFSFFDLGHFVEAQKDITVPKQRNALDTL